jgi:hypothetical protein
VLYGTSESGRFGERTENARDAPSSPGNSPCDTDNPRGAVSVVFVRVSAQRDRILHHHGAEAATDEPTCGRQLHRRTWKTGRATRLPLRAPTDTRKYRRKCARIG